MNDGCIEHNYFIVGEKVIRQASKDALKIKEFKGQCNTKKIDWGG